MLLLLCAWTARADAPPPGDAIAAAHPLAVQAGMDTLARGGNAFDAAIAVAATLGVVEPMSSGLGGGGFLLLHVANGREVMLDARERAPLAARADMYLDAAGNVVPRRSLDGPLAAGIPGTPAALVHLARRYGRLSLAQDLAPAIRYAREGFHVSREYRRWGRGRVAALAASPAAARIFLHDGALPPHGFLLRQPDLAATLEALAARGRDGFYGGAVAQRLVAGVRAAGGIWTQRDLDAYRVVERAPLVGHYGRLRVVTASPPSSGGVVLLEALHILSAYPLQHMNAARRDHLVIEAMRLAYRDRARYLGDPDFVHMDLKGLLSQAYASRLRREIHHRAGKSTPIVEVPDGRHTTHFSIIDHEGNWVAATLTINGPFGAAFVPPGTGVLLNNEMDDFVAKPGVPNLYGLVGSSANAIVPGKRPLSSMTPTFLESPRRVVVLGTPGGSRIISMVLLATLDVAEHRGGPRDWVARARFHHQYLPDVVEYEPGAFGPAEVRKLTQLGHVLKPLDHTYGNMQLVLWDKVHGRLTAAADPRGEGVGEVRASAARRAPAAAK